MVSLSFVLIEFGYRKRKKSLFRRLNDLKKRLEKQFFFLIISQNLSIRNERSFTNRIVLLYDAFSCILDILRGIQAGLNIVKTNVLEIPKAK